MTCSATAKAQRQKQLLLESSPLIDEYTSRVCPSCTDVCCRQRHGIFTEADRAYVAALAAEVPPHDPLRPLDGACQFMGASGCAKPRWQRAWKCTWFFCGPLLAALDEGPQRKARQLSAALEEMGRLYGKMKGE
jgi:hypothetical protein